MASSNTSDSTVLIVGSGPTGLVAALALAKNGVHVQVIEKSTTNRIGQRGAGILARTLEVFESLGFLDEVMKRSIPVPLVRLYQTIEGKGVSITEFELTPSASPTPACPYGSARLLGQDNLDKILRAELEKYGVAVELGVDLQAFEDMGDHVRVTLQRAGGEFEEAAYAYVLGADGARSTVRKQLGLAFMGESMGQEMLIGDVIVDGLSEDRFHMFGTKDDKRFGLRPTEVPRLFNFFLSGFKDVNMEDLLSSESCLRNYMGERLASRPDIKFGDFVCFGPYNVQTRMVDSLQRGRVFVAGDAGHIHPPTGGQGMNTGIQDSYNLAWKLALVIKGFSPTSLLSTFSAERIPIISEMLNLTTGYLKKTFLNNDAKVGDFKRRDTDNQLGINYRTSSIVMDDGASKQELEAFSTYGGAEGPICAGDRAPDAPGLVLVGDKSGRTIRLHELLKPTRHTVLVFADKCVDVLRAGQSAFSEYPQGLVQFIVLSSGKLSTPDSWAVSVYDDCDGHAYTAYTGPPESSSVFVIRPDGYIGARLGSIDKVEVYFKGIFTSHAD